MSVSPPTSQGVLRAPVPQVPIRVRTWPIGSPIGAKLRNWGWGMSWVPARPPAVGISAFLGPPLGVTPSSLSALAPRDPCSGSHPAWQEEQAATLKFPDPSPATSSLGLWKGMCTLGFTVSLLGGWQPCRMPPSQFPDSGAGRRHRASVPWD